METLIVARSLVDYIKSQEGFKFYEFKKTHGYNHIGALFTDIILQAGLNYKTVVKPRVERILLEFPEAYNLKNLIQVIEDNKIEQVINWHHSIKLNRFNNLIEFCLIYKINSCNDLKCFLSSKQNHKLFTAVNGLGPKTLDYTMKLLDFDTVAVDRHIISFVKLAGIDPVNYNHTKKVVEFAADLLNISRSSLDATIWHHMSLYFDSKIEEKDNQLELIF